MQLTKSHRWSLCEACQGQRCSQHRHLARWHAVLGTSPSITSPCPAAPCRSRCCRHQGRLLQQSLCPALQQHAATSTESPAPLGGTLPLPPAQKWGRDWGKSPAEPWAGAALAGAEGRSRLCLVLAASAPCGLDVSSTAASQSHGRARLALGEKRKIKRKKK